MSRRRDNQILDVLDQIEENTRRTADSAEDIYNEVVERNQRDAIREG